MKYLKEHKILTLSLLFITCIIVIIASLSIGTISFDFFSVIKAIFIADDSSARLIVLNSRLPRILVGGMIGISLSLAGCMLQCVMRNDLASPTTIGVSSGASFVGYILLVVFPTLSYLLPIATIIGALLTTILIYFLAYNKGVKPLKMILAGLAISAFLGAINDFIKTFFASDIANVSGFLVGGLNGITWDTFFKMLPFVVLAIIFVCFIPNKLNILMLGDETANSLGLHTQVFRFFLIIVSSILAASAIAFGGMIGFVGLIIPHIARILVGTNYKYITIASIFLGFTLMIISDTIGRVILPNSEVPVSIILSFIGVPFFIFLLRRKD